MRAKVYASGKRAYGCFALPGWPNCGGVSIQAEGTEAIVTEAVLGALESKAFQKALSRKRRADSDDGRAERDLIDAETRLIELAKDFGDGRTISKAEYLAMRKQAEARRDAARAAVSTVRKASALDAVEAAGLRDRWPRLSVDQRKAVLGAVIDRIEISPADMTKARRFDPDRIGISWRD
jgi:hypothetical protein